MYHSASTSNECSASLAGIFIVCFLDLTHSNRYVGVFHCCFNWQFPNEKWFDASFHIHIWHLFVFLWQSYYSDLLSSIKTWVVFFLLLSFKSSFYILDTNSFSDFCFVKLFLSVVVCFIILLIMKSKNNLKIFINLFDCAGS